MRSDIRRNLGFLFAGTFALALALALLATVTWSPQPAAASVTGADVVTVADGDWSDTSTWSTGDVPQAGQSVEVAAGHVVTFDADAVVQRLDIFGVLKFSRTTSTRLESRGNIIVREGGELLAGTPDNPLPWNVDATIVFDVQNGEDFVGGAMFDESDTGLWVFNGGRWESHGAPVEHTWTKLADDAVAGSASLVAQGDLTDWPVGGDVLITATGRNISQSIGTTDFPTEDEERQIVAVTDQGDGTTLVEFDAPLTYDHSGSGDARGEIALLTRNIVVTSKTDQRAHTLYMWGSHGAPTHTQFKKLGPDVFGRYPIHFHVMAETSIDKVIRGNVIWDSLNHWLVVHNSLGTLVEENIGYRALRTGFWLESTGAGEMGPKPMGNTFINNLACKVSSFNTADRRIGAFYAERENHFIGNVAVSVNGSTESSGYHWPEASIQSAGHTFVQNETHSSAALGLFGWQNTGDYHIVDFTTWRNTEGLKWGAYLNNVQFHGLNSFGNIHANFRARGNRPFIQDSVLKGEADYPTENGLFIDFYTLPPSPNNPGRTYRNVLSDHANYDINHLSQVDCQLSGEKCTPTFNAIVGTSLLSDNPIRFGNDWKTSDTYFDIQNWGGVRSDLPTSFRLTRPDQPKPSENAFYDEAFDAWVDPDHAVPTEWPLPPTIEWTSTPSSLGDSPVTFEVDAEGLDNGVGDIQFFVDEFEGGNPWVSEYFPNSDLGGKPVAVLDKADLKYRFGLETPPRGTLNLKASALLDLLPDGNWSARFTRTFTTTGGDYLFKYGANDGIRLYLNGELIKDQWSLSSACCSKSGTVEQSLDAGEHTVTVEFFAKSGDRAHVSFDMYRVLSGGDLSGTFTFDPAEWPRKYARIYARAYNPTTSLYAYTPVLTYRNPNFVLPVPDDSDSSGTTDEPGASPTPSATPASSPIAIPTETASTTEMTVEPEADTFVRDGVAAGENFGEEPDLVVKTSDNGFNRHSFLRFELSGISGPVTNAQITLYPLTVGMEEPFANQASLVSSEWNEMAMTWNTKLDGGDVIATWDISGTSPITFDVTNEVRAALSEGNKLAIVISAPTDAGAGAWVAYGSREHDGGGQPELAIQMSAVPVANAGEDQTLVDTDDDGSETVTLDGSGTDDPGDLISSYVWTIGDVEIGTGIAPEVNLPVGTHSVVLTVNDGLGGSTTDEVTITVEPAAEEVAATETPFPTATPVDSPTPVPTATATLAPTATPQATATPTQTAPVSSAPPPPPSGGGGSSSPAPTPTPSLSVPTSPLRAVAQAGDEVAVLTWDQPSDNGGSAISGYRVLVIPTGKTISVQGTDRRTTITGLENGVVYRFQVSAVNSIGMSNASAPSNEVIPVGPTPVPTPDTEQMPTPTPTPVFSAPEPPPTPEKTADVEPTVESTPLTPAATPTYIPTPNAQATATPVPVVEPTTTPSPEPGESESQTLQLTPGWNLISFNVSPTDPDIRTVMASIEGQYTEVSTIMGSSAVVFRPDRSDDLNTLRELDTIHAYWIRVVSETTLTIEGTQVHKSSPIELHEGWNMVSYRPATPLPVITALGSISGKYDEVRGFEVEGMSYFPMIPRELNTLKTMHPGLGYLIHATEEAVLIYP
ncbi:MAG: DNRLRE domain-containing protein [Dehalococcoidia bacterium]